MAGTGESKQDGLGLSGTNPKVGQFSSFPASAESLRCSDETRDIDSVKNRGVLSHYPLNTTELVGSQLTIMRPESFQKR